MAFRDPKWYGAFAPIYQSVLPKVAMLGRGCIRTYFALASFSRTDDPIVFASVSTLAGIANKSCRSVHRDLALLHESGLVRRLGPECGRRACSRELVFPIEGQFGRVPVRFRSELCLLGNSVVAIYACLCTFRNQKTGLAFPSRNTLAELSQVSVRTVTTALKRLAEYGFIRRTGYTQEGVSIWFLSPRPEKLPWLKVALVANHSSVQAPQSGRPEKRGTSCHPLEANGINRGTRRQLTTDAEFLQTDQRIDKENTLKQRENLIGEMQAVLQLPLWQDLLEPDRKQLAFEVVREFATLEFPAGRLLRVLLNSKRSSQFTPEEAVRAAVEALEKVTDLGNQLRKVPDWEYWQCPGVLYFGGDDARETSSLPEPWRKPLHQWAGNPNEIELPEE